MLLEPTQIPREAPFDRDLQDLRKLVLVVRSHKLLHLGSPGLDGLDQEKRFVFAPTVVSL